MIDSVGFLQVSDAPLVPPYLWPADPTAIRLLQTLASGGATCLKLKKGNKYSEPSVKLYRRYFSEAKKAKGIKL